MEKKMLIEGMKCNHCKMIVEKTLNAVPGVTGAEVKLEEKTAVIRMEADVPDQLLIDAVRSKGFTPVEIIR